MRHIGIALIFCLLGMPTAFAASDTIPPQALKAGRFVQMKIDGLACPFCLYGIRKQLGKLKGTDGLDASFKNSEATIWIRPGSPTRMADVYLAVKNAGFKVSEFTITDAGHVKLSGDTLIFTSLTNGEQFQILGEKADRPHFMCSLTGTITEIPEDARKLPAIRIVPGKMKIFLP